MYDDSREPYDNGWNYDDDGKLYWPDGAPWAPTPSGRPTEDANFDPLPPPTGGQTPPDSPPTPPGPLDRPNPLPPGPPRPPAGPSGPSGGGHNTPGTFNVSSSWPTFTAPALPTIAPLNTPPAFSFDAYTPAQPFSFDSYAAPQPFAYDDFSHDPFAAPTMDQAKAEPGYEFARTEGLRAFMNARLPTLRTGGTMKDLIGWGNRFAEQNYGNVYNRSADTYDRNRGNAFGTWQANRGNAFENWGANERARAESYDRNRGNAFENWTTNERTRAEAYDRNRNNAADAYKTNWGISTDVYDRNTGTALDVFDRRFRNAAAEFDPRMDAAKLTFSDIYNRDRDKLDALTRIATAGAGA